jgi:hypothetical protein
MSKDPFHSWIVQQIAEKRASGWERPVILCLHPDLERAQAVHRALTGEPLELPANTPTDNEYFRPVVAPLDAACAALREHCGPGGDFVARQFADPLAPADGWLASLFPDEIAYVCFCGGEKVFTDQQPYACVGRRKQTLGETLEDDGPSRMGLVTSTGEQVVIFGRSGMDAALAGVLVATVNSRRITVEREGRTVSVPCTEDGLARMLAKVYADGDGPHQVAEAIAALKKLPGNKEAWLLRVLRNRPGLEELNRRVRFEMTGEAG